MHINTTNLPSGEFSCWGLLLAQRPENSCTRGRSRSSCVWTNALFVHPPTGLSPVKNCRCDAVIFTRNILSSRYYSYFLSAPRDPSRSHFLFASPAPRKREKGKRERAEDKLAKMRKCHEVCVRIYRRRYTRDAFSLHLRISFLSFLPSPSVKSQTSVVARSSVLCTYSRNRGSAQFCEGISPGSGVFTESYNFAAVYNLWPQGSLCLSAVRSLCERSIC